jgi:hypothetical protein
LAKKQETRGYGESYIPEGNGKRYSSSRAFAKGLDLRCQGDTMTMSACKNIDVKKLPEIASVEKSSRIQANAAVGFELKGFYGYDDKLFYILESGTTVKLVRTGKNIAVTEWTLDEEEAENISGKNREMAVFCWYNPTGTVPDKDGKVELFYDMTPTYYLIVAPDRRYIPIDFTNDTIPEKDAVSPIFDHITVWNSRLFGARDSVVVCSSAGTFKDWTCDTPEASDAAGLTLGGYDATHAWYSTTQANTQSTGDITAITAYDGHPIIFKDDYMHQINNNKNPFRIQDIVAVGCVSARSVCELDGVLYFASRDGIYRYGGGYPSCISEPLNCSEYGANVVCGAYDGVLYVYNPMISSKARIYTYCPANGLWAAIENPHGKDIIAFATNELGVHSIDADGTVYRLPKDDGSEDHADWFVTSDRMFFGSAGDKRLHSLEVVAKGENIGFCIVRDDTTPITITAKELSGVDTVRYLIRKTDSVYNKLRLSGDGEIKVFRADLVYSYSGQRYR